MQEKEISAIHGCSKGKFLLPMDAANWYASVVHIWKFFTMPGMELVASVVHI